jgi:ABC-2 type transport system permease protein
MRRLTNIYWLGRKELRSFFQDYVLLALVIWSFSFAIVSQAQSTGQEVHNASIAIVDEDRSQLSQRIAGAFLPPYFRSPREITVGDVDRAMDVGEYTFVVDFPPGFERDAIAGRVPTVQLNVDATAMTQAGVGAGYAEQIISTEARRYLAGNDTAPSDPVSLVLRIAFNPNVSTAWFNSIMGIINNVTMLAIILAGAAIVREREHGTMDHLLAMPVTPFEIAMAKIWANGLIVAVSVALSLNLVVRGILGVPVNGSISLFLLGVCIYLFFATAVGIFLGTIARSMPQLGLLYILVAMPMNLLSGSNTPIDSMPWLLRNLMRLSPSSHFVSFAQSILYRGAGFDVVWPEFLAIAVIGALFLYLAMVRFRRTMAFVA